MLKHLAFLPVLLLSVTGAAAQTTWASGDCGAGIALSSGDTIAERTASGWKACRSTTSHNFDGNYIFQIDAATDDTSNQGILVGVGDASATLSSYVGSDSTGWGWQILTFGAFVGCYHSGNNYACGGASWSFTPTPTAYVKVDTAGNVQVSADCSTWYTPNAAWTPISTANPIYIMASLQTQGAATYNRVTIRPDAPGCGAYPGGYIGWDMTPTPSPALFPGSLNMLGVGH